MLVGGQPIGTVDDIKLTQNAQAEVEITVDEPASRGHDRGHPGHVALRDRQPLHLDLPGPQLRAADPRGRHDPADKTTSPVDIDQLFNTFNAKTRKGLADFIQGQGTVYTGNGEGREQGLQVPRARACSRPTRLLAELTRDQQTFSEFLASGSRVLGAIAERRNDLSALTSNANQALGAIAAENDRLRPLARRSATGAAPGEHDLRQPPRRARRPRSADRGDGRGEPAGWPRSCASSAPSPTSRSRSSRTSA